MTMTSMMMMATAKRDRDRESDEKKLSNLLKFVTHFTKSIIRAMQFNGFVCQFHFSVMSLYCHPKKIIWLILKPFLETPFHESKRKREGEGDRKSHHVLNLTLRDKHSRAFTAIVPYYLVNATGTNGTSTGARARKWRGKWK